jgi:hypothetical protein
MADADPDLGLSFVVVAAADVDDDNHECCCSVREPKEEHDDEDYDNAEKVHNVRELLQNVVPFLPQMNDSPLSAIAGVVAELS